ncbi:hypothetical protein BU24DRAFT_417631 [Aaosphaeria arxii CBS 175.79]|uniref:Nibrin second BRCT domain-containing protein n=1 Tax=Aaosphaeria arxii CBS 175.79 TaxID=1450172 RepID=A0A6A5Y9H2_9PLEO|nr:uncharacterized protein BU24DRAFT_417631 [Aaosphaeria arxii CBS 175.79]KAF2021989.1 hypothetical protein BU24DRAFT_417631 [Aaosphaeria arxii CBS 175.79]
MWFLEHESLFGGKRVWLRPGSQQLYGRTSKAAAGEEGKSIFIDHKAVSRQHMMIKVLDVPAEDGSKLHARSQVVVTDLSCRQGTTIDGDKKLLSKKEAGGGIEYDRYILPGTEHTIRLIESYPPFRLTWQPFVFTFASKESKARSTQLHALDVKTTTDFVYGKTTHVVSQKRNLPKVLQGLVAGVHIVTADFLDAVLRLATPQNANFDNFRASKLEEDFDLCWPKEKEYVPPVGAEPVPRDGRLLEPDTSRGEVFKGLTFVFMDENQYNSLHEPITGGNGKALLFNVRLGETTVAEYVDYVHSVVGKKKPTKATGDQLPVVTIRLPIVPEGLEDWASEFVTGVDYALNQRSVLQNEFLDAIISNDASALRKPPPEAEAPSSTGPAAKMEPMSSPRHTRARSREPSQAAEEQQPTKTNSRKRPMRRGATASRFTGFDDYEPPAKLRKVEEDTPMEDVPSSNLPQESHGQTQSSHELPSRRSQRHQSPAVPSVEVPQEDNQIDQLFPAAAAMKRQRAATRAASASVEPETQAGGSKKRTVGGEVLAKLQKSKMKVSKEIDVREATRQRLQEQEEQRKADEEKLREALEGVDISEIRGLVKVEEMEIRPRQDRARLQQQQQAGTSSDRWKEEWNGRKNFKKFRRKGGVERPPAREKAIVALEEAPHKKGLGLGDAFLLDNVPSAQQGSSKDKDNDDDTTQPSTRTRKGSSKPAAVVVQDSESDSEEEPGFVRRKRSSPPEVINVEDSEPEISPDPPVPRGTAGTRSSGRTTQRVEETQVTTANTQTQTQTQRGSRKRAAPPAAAAGPSKRTRTKARGDDSDDEETGFRLRKRK